MFLPFFLRYGALPVPFFYWRIYFALCGLSLALFASACWVSVKPGRGGVRACPAAAGGRGGMTPVVLGNRIFVWPEASLYRGCGHLFVLAPDKQFLDYVMCRVHALSRMDLAVRRKALLAACRFPYAYGQPWLRCYAYSCPGQGEGGAWAAGILEVTGRHAPLLYGHGRRGPVFADYLFLFAAAVLGTQAEAQWAGGDFRPCMNLCAGGRAPMYYTVQCLGELAGMYRAFYVLW